MIGATYIQTNNLEGAYARYLSASSNYKSRWWEVVENIYHSAKKWAREYIIDPVNRTLTKIVKRGRKKSFYLEDVMDFKCEASGCGAYIVQHFDEEGHPLWIKCGKADDAQKRLAEHFQKDYKGEAVRGVCLAWFPCVDEDMALTAENVIRRHFVRKGFYKMGNDRFPDLVELTSADLMEITAKINIISSVW